MKYALSLLGVVAFAAAFTGCSSPHRAQSKAQSRSEPTWTEQAGTRKVDHRFLPTAPPSHCPAGQSCPGPTPPLVEIAHTTLSLGGPASIVVVSSADFYLSAAKGTGGIDLLVRVDGVAVGQCDGFAAGGNGNTIACEGFVKHARPGRHKIELRATATGNRQVGVGPLSLSAIATPLP